MAAGTGSRPGQAARAAPAGQYFTIFGQQLVMARIGFRPHTGGMTHNAHLSWAPVPPMGWNSWDAYGASVTEAEIRANAAFMARELKPHGWEYVVVDIQWYEPEASSSWYRKYAPLEMDQWSRLVPAASRFPSARDGQGFKPLADHIHGLGLKFGIHMMRGIPRQAAHAATPILGAGCTARDLAQVNSICPWNTDMYGVDPGHPAAQAYYDSVFALYAAWGVDYVKVDDLGASRLYGAHLEELRLIHRAILKSGRPMVLSVSPGPAALDQGTVLADNANLWRITDDYWDRWDCLKDMFDRCRRWYPFAGDGHWPDCDMLPLGRIGLRNHDGGAGDRQTRFSPDEQLTMMSLWALARSPLMMGGVLPDADPWTLSLLSNPEVLAVNQSGTRPEALPAGPDEAIWLSRAAEGGLYLGLFNLADTAREVTVDLASLGLAGPVALRDLWARQDQAPASGRLACRLPAHACRLLRLG